ncbi:hypothetical protein M5K25_010056 [Dendrobium thyrsiflorum]|uniref:PUM-HD domain-containing protein n=1 Tax=Dendrobium thyrsiflorum TaxID=117978 RepID=A0ABD0UZU2_DENTH
MISDVGMSAMIGGSGEGFNIDDLGIYRSGSALPTVEGSMTAMNELFTGDASRFWGLTEEEVRSDPAHLSYYYSKSNLNPRLPPPVMSKEDWRFQSGSSAVGGIGDRMKIDRVEEEDKRSLFSMQPGFVVKEEDGEEDSLLVLGSGEWLDKRGDGLSGLTGLTAGRQRTFADLFQNNQREKSSISSPLSLPTSHNAFDAGKLLRPGQACASIHQDVSFQKDASSTTPTLAPLLGPSLSKNNSPDPQLAARAHKTHVPPIGVKIGNGDQKNTPSNYFRTSSGLMDPDDLIAALSGITLSNENIMRQSGLQKEGDDDPHNSQFNLQGMKNHSNKHSSLQKTDSGQEIVSSANQSANSAFPDLVRNCPASVYFNNPEKRPHKQFEMNRSSLPSNSPYVNGPSVPVGNSVVSLVQCPSSTDGSNASFKSYGMSGHSVNALASMMGNHVAATNMPPLFENSEAAYGFESLGMETRVLGGGPSSGANLNTLNLENLNKIGRQTPHSALHLPCLDPYFIQYLSAVQASTNSNEPSLERGCMSNSYAELLEMKKAYLGSTVFQPQHHFGLRFFGKSGYYGNPACSLGMSYPGRPVASPVLHASPVGPNSPLRHGGPNMHFPTSMRNFSGNAMGSWHLDNGGHMNDGHESSLLEELKNNKANCFELSDIAGHVVEFSADQYGSRFIQQKLETATAIEKDMFFVEILPQALSLMTDVFGNYVVQKFFDYGSAAQRRELADQLTGHILTRSLQMYGCRVIQKAIEVVDLDQQTKMVLELDGHVMRCVRDQNGNHVIQKCIECIPQDAIQFIISTFYDQVITLSTHPYGCRVIQRILEYCDDPKTQQIMMDEILQCVCLLAQDQYGNYVVQHVLEHGKPHERSAIIEKLTGQIVHMSQQKFASNVVEKCLTFAGPEERQLLVNEMLGTTEDNEPLQAMMKDQFANYVVQKVLETCDDDQQRELILSRVKVHLNSLKKYTYGKHIVARVEKLVAAGERRLGVSVM